MIKNPNNLLNEDLLPDESGELETWIVLKYSDSTYTAISDDMDEVYGSSIDEIRKKIEKHARNIEGYDLKVGSIEFNDKPQTQVVGEVNVTYLFVDKLEENKKSDNSRQLRESLGARKYNKIMKFINECVKEGIEVELTIPKKKLLEKSVTKKYIVFDHFDPEELYFIKNIPSDSWIWDSSWIIQDVTDKHGNCLISNDNESISVSEMGNKTLSDFDKEIIELLKKDIEQNPNSEYLYVETENGMGFDFDRDELPDNIDSMTPFTDFVEDSYVDGDSNSQYQVINLDTQKFGQFGVDIFEDEDDEEELEDEYLDRYTYVVKTSVKYNQIPGLADHYLMFLKKEEADEIDLYIKKANELGYNIREIKGKEIYTHPATKDTSLSDIEMYRHFVLTPKNLDNISNNYFEDPKFNAIEDNLKVQTDNWTKESGSISGENNYEREKIIRRVLQLHNYRTSIMVSEDDKLIIYYNKKKLEEGHPDWNDKMPGYYGESIFGMLDEMSGDQIQKFLNEYDLWEPLNLSKGASTESIYDAINRYLDTDPGYGLYRKLSNFN